MIVFEIQTVMGRLSYVLLLASLALTRIPAQSRDDWRMKPLFLYEGRHPLLAAAKITRQDRAVIYHALDDKMVRDTTPGDPKAERAAVLDSEISHIVLAQDGSSQVMVLGPKTFCGTGGCPIHIFVRQNGQLRLAFGGGANGLVIRKTVTKGYHDFATHWRFGATDNVYSVYRWTGHEYKAIDCYYVTFTTDDQKVPTITSCKRSPTPSN